MRGRLPGDRDCGLYVAGCSFIPRGRLVARAIEAREPWDLSLGARVARHGTKPLGLGPTALNG